MEKNVYPEIAIGSFVGLKKNHQDSDVHEILQKWIGLYGRGPFLVWGKIDPFHVSLKDKDGKFIHFGSTVDPSIHVGYVEPWLE